MAKILKFKSRAQLEDSTREKQRVKTNKQILKDADLIPKPDKSSTVSMDSLFQWIKFKKKKNEINETLLLFLTYIATQRPLPDAICANIKDMLIQDADKGCSFARKALVDIHRID